MQEKSAEMAQHLKAFKQETFTNFTTCTFVVPGNEWEELRKHRIITIRNSHSVSAPESSKNAFLN